MTLWISGLAGQLRLPVLMLLPCGHPGAHIIAINTCPNLLSATLALLSAQPILSPARLPLVVQGSHTHGGGHRKKKGDKLGDAAAGLGASAGLVSCCALENERGETATRCS